MQKEKTIRKGQKIKKCNFKKIYKELIQTKKSKKGTTDEKINSLLSCRPNFIGCFAEDEVSKIKFTSFPCFLIVNTDSSSLPGSHWIALGVFKDRVEIFDPLGFKFFNWSRIPCDLLKTLHKLSQHRRLLISQRIQSDQSNLCAFYCIYYCIFRSTVTFSKICLPFKSLEVNDKILSKQFL